MDWQELQKRLQVGSRWQTIGRIACGIANRLEHTLAPLTRECEAARDQLPRESEAYWHLTSAIKASRQAGDLVSRLLSICSAGSAQRAEVPIGPVVHDALHLARTAAPPSVEIRMSIEDGDHTAVIDETQVQHLIVTICLNAFDAMADKGGLLEVTMDAASGPAEKGATLQLTFTDSTGSASHVYMPLAAGPSRGDFG